jgi:hypothetical protein
MDHALYVAPFYTLITSHPCSSLIFHQLSFSLPIPADSTDQHGASLTTFYRLLEAYSRKSPQAGNILIVRDALGRRFGVFMNEVIKKVEGTYTGSGES